MNLKCQSCGAQLVVEEGLRTATCPYCGSSSVVERPPEADRPPPAFVLGFTQTESAAKQAMRSWLRSCGPFTQSSFKAGVIDNLRGVYLPAYLYTAVAASDYSASIGENYTELQTYTVNGRTKTRIVTKTEWRPLKGRHAEYVADVLVTASRGLPNDELEKIEPFDLRMMRRYAPALIAGWIAEDPSLSQSECFELARGEARQKTEARLANFMPGDSHRELQFAMRLENEALDLCLVPVWVAAIRHDAENPPVRVLVNGQTGEVFGKPPLSKLKIAAAIVAGLAVIGGALLAYYLLGGAL